MLKPTRSTLNGREVARQLVADAIIPAIQVRVERIREDVARPLNEAIDGFFADLTTYMGKPEDLADQLGGEAGMLGQWKPLTSAYIQRKGNDSFWLFTNGLGAEKFGSLAQRILKKAHNIRAGKNGKVRLTSKRVRRVQDSALIPTLGRLTGTAVFGPVAVKVSQRSERLMTYRPGDQPVDAKVVHLTVKLWTRWDRSQRADPDRSMFDQGDIDQKTLYKLSNFREQRPDYYRPLVKPFMSYYGLVKLPKILQQIAREIA